MKLTPVALCLLITLLGCTVPASPTPPSSKPTLDVSAIETRAAQTVIAQITRRAPTATIKPTGSPTSTATLVPTKTRTHTSIPTRRPSSTFTPTLPPGQPSFVNHPRPPLTVDFQIFENVGCPPDQDGVCDSNSELGRLGCDEIQKPRDLLGGLAPTYPIALCYVVPWRRPDRGEPPAGTYLFREGGLRGMYARYVIYRNERFELIQTADQFRAIYAPIETPNEALSYAVAVTNLSAFYGLVFDADLVYFVDRIEDTFARREGDGFLVHLFYYRFFGCGPHATSVHDLRVARDGLIQEVKVQDIFKDPNLDGLCVD